MRTRPTLAIAGAAALATALIAGAVTAPAAPTTRSATERYYVSETWHAFSGTPGRASRPTSTRSRARSRPKAGKKTGMVNGYAINLRPPFVAWSLTATVPAAPLTMASTVNQESKPRVLVISGGTGRYLGAGGTVSVDGRGRPRRPRDRHARAARLLMTRRRMISANDTDRDHLRLGQAISAHGSLSGRGHNQAGLPNEETKKDAECARTNARPQHRTPQQRRRRLVVRLSGAFLATPLRNKVIS